MARQSAQPIALAAFATRTEQCATDEAEGRFSRRLTSRRTAMLPERWRGIEICVANGQGTKRRRTFGRK
eukprot:scaffold126648_cov31-Tisochrysis_lutea.AAC.8